MQRFDRIDGKINSNFRVDNASGLCLGVGQTDNLHFSRAACPWWCFCFIFVHIYMCTCFAEKQLEPAAASGGRQAHMFVAHKLFHHFYPYSYPVPSSPCRPACRRRSLCCGSIPLLSVPVSKVPFIPFLLFCVSFQRRYVSAYPGLLAGLDLFACSPRWNGAVCLFRAARSTWLLVWPLSY